MFSCDKYPFPRCCRFDCLDVSSSIRCLRMTHRTLRHQQARQVFREHPSVGLAFPDTPSYRTALMSAHLMPLLTFPCSTVSIVVVSRFNNKQAALADKDPFTIFLNADSKQGRFRLFAATAVLLTNPFYLHRGRPHPRWLLQRNRPTLKERFDKCFVPRPAVL